MRALLYYKRIPFSVVGVSVFIVTSLEINSDESETAGSKGCSPRGVSAVTLKWPVNAGPTVDGRESGST
jgi:hypothetical protein